MQGKPTRRHSSRYYESVLDLREFGHDLILHGHARLSKSGDHKVELVDTGKMSLSHMLNEISQIFDVDPEKLAIMRVDLTADVPGIPVSWTEKPAPAAEAKTSEAGKENEAKDAKPQPRGTIVKCGTADFETSKQPSK